MRAIIQESASSIFLRNLAYAYLLAKQYIIDAGFDEEISWQSAIKFQSISEKFFLREAAWVVLSAGMRELVIRKIFPDISLAFLDWESAQEISRQADTCCELALRRFNNKRKIDAILYIAHEVSDKGFEFIKKSIEVEGVKYISQFPYMGPATAAHLAKNLGISISKPDRHLNRIAKTAGFESAEFMCESISEYVGDNIAEVDLVLWRYATLNQNYLALFELPTYTKCDDSKKTFIL